MRRFTGFSEGEWRGRTLPVDISRRSRTRYAGEVRCRRYHGHRLNINLGASLQTRLIVFPSTSAAG